MKLHSMPHEFNNCLLSKGSAVDAFLTPYSLLCILSRKERSATIVLMLCYFAGKTGFSTSDGLFQKIWLVNNKRDNIEL